MKALFDNWQFIVAMFAVVAASSVALYRIDDMEKRQDKIDDLPVTIAVLKRDVRSLRCETGNIKRLIRNQPENDC